MGLLDLRHELVVDVLGAHREHVVRQAVGVRLGRDGDARRRRHVHVDLPRLGLQATHLPVLAVGRAKNYPAPIRWAQATVAPQSRHAPKCSRTRSQFKYDGEKTEGAEAPWAG